MVVFSQARSRRGRGGIHGVWSPPPRNLGFTSKTQIFQWIVGNWWYILYLDPPPLKNKSWQRACVRRYGVKSERSTRLYFIEKQLRLILCNDVRKNEVWKNSKDICPHKPLSRRKMPLILATHREQQQQFRSSTRVFLFFNGQQRITICWCILLYIFLNLFCTTLSRR